MAGRIELDFIHRLIESDGKDQRDAVRIMAERERRDLSGCYESVAADRVPRGIESGGIELPVLAHDEEYRPVGRVVADVDRLDAARGHRSIAPQRCAVRIEPLEVNEAVEADREELRIVAGVTCGDCRH